MGSHKKFSVAHLTSHTPRPWQKNRLLVNHPYRPLQYITRIVNTSTNAEFHDEFDGGNDDDRSALRIMNLLPTHHIRKIDTSPSSLSNYDEVDDYVPPNHVIIRLTHSQ